MDSDPKIKNYVFSRRRRVTLLDGFERAKEPIKAFMGRLRRHSGKDIWMMGGGEIIASFLDVEEIDEFSIHVVPVFIGEGIPLIKPQHRFIPLKLLSTRKFSDGVVHLNYQVLRRPVQEEGALKSTRPEGSWREIACSCRLEERV